MPLRSVYGISYKYQGSSLNKRDPALWVVHRVGLKLRHSNQADHRKTLSINHHYLSSFWNGRKQSFPLPLHTAADKQRKTIDRWRRLYFMFYILCSLYDSFTCPCRFLDNQGTLIMDSSGLTLYFTVHPKDNEHSFKTWWNKQKKEQREMAFFNRCLYQNLLYGMRLKCPSLIMKLPVWEDSIQWTTKEKESGKQLVYVLHLSNWVLI